MTIRLLFSTLGLCIVLIALTGPALAAAVTNADVVKLLEAGMPEEIVLKAISNGEPHFNTSSDELVHLKTKGATPAILSAMMSARGDASERKTSSTRSPAATERGVANPEQVLVVVDGQESTMQYLVPDMRMAARALGFGGMASYATLRGAKAAHRLPSSGMQFIVSVPKNAQVSGYLTLASLAERKNGTREVSTGGGYMSYSTGINNDRVVAIKSDPLGDQSRARDGFVLFSVTPSSKLASGEYALVLYTAEVRTVGFFAQAANSFFDFGVD